MGLAVAAASRAASAPALTAALVRAMSVTSSSRTAAALRERRAGGGAVSLHQVHSVEAVIATAPWPDEARPHADAVVTDRPGLILGIVTADCAPILLADREAGVIAAAHAGWKGAVGGILAATVSSMESLGAERKRIAAAVGPMIAQASYEVDDPLRDHYLAADPANERFFAAGRPDHWQFDLEGFVVAQLADAGVGRIEALGLDTYADPDRFYSFRRATHRHDPDYGRHLSLIAL